MSAGLELVQTEEWLYSTLRNRAQLGSLVGGTADPRIYSHLAPEGTVVPHVTILLLNASEEHGINGAARTMVADYLVQGITQSHSMAGAGTIASEIDAALHAQSGTVVGLSVLECKRQSPVSEIELRDGVRYNHVGGTYRLHVANST